MSLREELWNYSAFWAGPRMGAAVSAQDLVGVLHHGPVENRRHPCFDVVDLNDALVESGVAGLRGKPSAISAGSCRVAVYPTEGAGLKISSWMLSGSRKTSTDP